jgi:hypothetical protein
MQVIGPLHDFHCHAELVLGPGDELAGDPVAVKKGAAKVAVPAWHGHGVVTASYSGDRYYNPSTGEGAL